MFNYDIKLSHSWLTTRVGQRGKTSFCPLCPSPQPPWGRPPCPTSSLRGRGEWVENMLNRLTGCGELHFRVKLSSASLSGPCELSEMKLYIYSSEGGVNGYNNLVCYDTPMLEFLSLDNLNGISTQVWDYPTSSPLFCGVYKENGKAYHTKFYILVHW